MRSPLDDVPAAPVLGVENASLRLVFWAVFFLLIFALAYLAIMPLRVPDSYTTLAWNDSPHFVVQEDGPPNTGHIVFSLALHSFERENTSYRVNIQYEGKTIASKNVSLATGELQLVDFSIPTKGELDSYNQIHVLVTKPGADVNANNDAPLELVGYFPGN